MRSGESRFVRSKSDILGQKDTFSHVNAFTLTGPSSTWEIEDSLVVGDAGTGNLNILEGGLVTVYTGLTIGAQAGSQGTVTVGLGSYLLAGEIYEPIGDITVGDFGTGNLFIINGGSLSASGTIVIGAQDGSQGTLIISGSGSSWYNDSTFTIGKYGTGTLSVLDGAAMGIGGLAILGVEAGSHGTVTISGSNSSIFLGGVTVGDAGTGIFSVLDGALVNSWTISIGKQTGAQGAATVSGAGSTWTTTGALIVGDAGAGNLFISNGATVNASNGDLSVGVSGAGTVGLADGALLTNSNGYIGSGEGSAGSVAVTNSVWQNAGNLMVGGTASRAILRIADGGKVTVGGDYSQAANSTLHFALSAKSKHGGLFVTGAADIDGALEVSYLNGFHVKRGEKVTLITADDLSGKFADFSVVGTRLFLNPTLIYESNAVLLEFDQASFAALVDEYRFTANQLAVARKLDKIVNDRRVAGLIGKLNSLPVDQIPGAIALLSPEDYAAIFNVGFATAQVQLENIQRRLEDVRNGATGFSDNGLALSNSHGALNYDGSAFTGSKNDGLTLAGWDGESVVGKQAVAPVLRRDNRWGFFATGTGEFGDVETTAAAPGWEFTTGGVTLGADYRFGERAILGMTLGYANTDTDLSGGGNLNADSGKASLYGSLFGGGFYLNAAAGGGYTSYDTKRNTFGGYARGDTDGADFNALLGGGYDAHIGAFTIGPVASVQYAYVSIEGFTEHGSLAPMHIDSQSQDSLKTTVGLRASYGWNLGNVVITPELRAQWLHEYLDSTATVESSFAAGDPFTVHGPEIGRDSLLLDAGLSVQFSPGVAVFAYYTGEIGRENYSSNSVNSGVRLSF